MSNRVHQGAGVCFLERRVTRDARVPISADDLEMENGWRSIPIPPTEDGRWFIIDSHSKDYKTIWGRWWCGGGHA